MAKINGNLAETMQYMERTLRVRENFDLMCRILRIGSIDYNMMSENEQETIENVLMQTALTFDGFVQFLTTTENIDTNEIINDIKKPEIAIIFIQIF